jgi:hypothetical protein
VQTSGIASRVPVVREFVTAALYVAIVLLALLAALPRDRILVEGSAIGGLLVGSAVGLVVAHWLAFRLAVHLTSPDRVSAHDATAEAAAQIAGGLAVGLIAAAPFVLTEPEPALLLSLLLLAALPALAGAAIARLRGRSWVTAAITAVVVLAMTAIVVGVKNALGH